MVVITGASSGIGKALSITFSQKGYAVVMAARNAQKLKEACDEVKLYSEHVITVLADVSSEDDCKKIIDRAIEAFGQIDVLINNAGISMRALFTEMDLSVMHALMGVNFWGMVYCTKFAIPHLLKTQGSLVGISSIAGKKGLPGRCGYSASKFAMEGFLETIRTENLKNKLHVLVACPGYTASNIRNSALSKNGDPQIESPLDEKKLMPAADVSLAIYGAVQHRKRDLILTRNGKLTVWLNRFFPQWMDKIVYDFVAKEDGSPFK